MWPGSRAGADIVVGYPITLPRERPLLSQVEELFEYVDTIVSGEQSIFAGCAAYDVDSNEPIDADFIFLGFCVASVHGEPDISAFSLQVIQEGWKKLIQFSKSFPTLCQELSQEYSFIPENLYDTTPVIAFLLYSGGGQSDATLGLGSYGPIIYHEEKGWNVKVYHDERRSAQLTTRVQEEFGLTQEPGEVLWDVKEYLCSLDFSYTHTWVF